MFNTDEDDNSECTARIMIGRSCQNFMSKLGNRNLENLLKRSPENNHHSVYDTHNDENTASKKLKLEIEVETKNVELIAAKAKIVELESRLERQKQRVAEMDIKQEGIVNKMKNEHKLELEKLKSCHDDSVNNSKQILELRNEIIFERKRKSLANFPINDDSAFKQNLQLSAEIEKLKIDKLNIDRNFSIKLRDLEQLVKELEAELTNTNQQLHIFKNVQSENSELKTVNEELTFKLSAILQRVKDLEQELLQIDSGQKQARLLRCEVERLKFVDSENNRLLKENCYNKITQENIGLLEEKLLSANSKLKRNEEQLANLNLLELENKSLHEHLNAFEELMQMFPIHDRNASKMMRAFKDLQRESNLLQLSKGELQTKVKILSSENVELSTKLGNLKSEQKIENEKLNKIESRFRQLTKTTNYLRLERDKLKEIIDSFDADFSHNMSIIAVDNIVEAQNKVVRLSEDYALIRSKRCEELELENDKLTASLQKMEHQLLLMKRTEQPAPSSTYSGGGLEGTVPADQDIISTLRLKVENLTKQNEEILSEHEANKTFIQWLQNQGVHDPRRTKIICLADNPTAAKRKNLRVEVETYKTENAKLKVKLDLLRTGGGGGGQCNADISSISLQKAHDNMDAEQAIEALKSEVGTAKKMIERLKEAFMRTSDDLRNFILGVLGYRIDVVATRKYKLMSVFAETQHDFLHFTMSKEGLPSLADTEYCQSFTHLIGQYLERSRSIPAFMAALSLDLFNRQTMMTTNSRIADNTEYTHNDTNTRQH